MAESTIKTPIDPIQIGPVTVFDLHLKVLSESYIAFFQEKIKIEESYIDALQRIHMKWRAVDSIYDDRTPSTVRRAWREVRDNLEREAETRSALVSSIRSDVLAPLAALRETQDRTRKRIKEDLKMSHASYAQYAENDLPKLKRNYLRKCQDVEDYKSTPPVPSSTTSQTQQSQEIQPTALQRNTSQPITSPAPLRPPNRQPSITQPTTRNRSPSGSTSFSDLAHQGKKQLNHLKAFLNEGKGGTARDGFGGRAEGALRGVRAKREADDADKEYRKGVHWLETLRLNRVKILEGGYKSLELFIHESTDKIKGALERYVDGMTATAATTSQLCKHIQESVAQISADKDTLAVTSQTARSMSLATPRHTPYYNFYVGECKDLVFGVSLVDYATSRGLPDGSIPRVVNLCVEEVEKRGIDSEGIYRISGRHANVQDISQKIERDEAHFIFNAITDDVYSISSTFKLYLRELPEPVFRFPLHERLQYTEDRDNHIGNNFRVLKAKIRRMAPIHQATLRCIIEHLSRIASNHEKNKMDAKNLAIVFGAVIFGEDEMPKGGDILSVNSWKDTLMEDLISHSHVLYDENTSDQFSPLPPAPNNEPQPRYDYGSSYTHVASLPPKEASHSLQASGDFAPRLPLRPEESIHPSRRAGKAHLSDEDELQGELSASTGAHEQDDIMELASSPTEPVSGRTSQEHSIITDTAATQVSTQQEGSRSSNAVSPTNQV